MIFGHFIDFGHFPIEIPIGTEFFFFFMAKEMGLDRAPIEFRKLVFLVPPNLVVMDVVEDK